MAKEGDTGAFHLPQQPYSPRARDFEYRGKAMQEPELFPDTSTPFITLTL